MTVRVGILDYGNLGKGVECTIKHNPNMELKAVFTRRNPDSLNILTEGAEVYWAGETLSMKDEIDVVILYGRSAANLPTQTPETAAHFNVIGNFDTHTNIPRHFEAMDKATEESGHVGIIPADWGPGMFLLNRLYANAILPGDSDYTFWGRGMSQDHSDAIRKIKGVKDARQYTIPVKAALMAVRSGKAPELATRDEHTRECFAMTGENADLKAIEETIVTMPNYFADYDTTVRFISQKEPIRDYAGIPHGGFVIHADNTGWNDENGHVVEYDLRPDSNPEFMASIIVAYARTAYRLSRGEQSGCRTVFDIASTYLSPVDGAELRKHLL